MLKEALETLIEDGRLPLVWGTPLSDQPRTPRGPRMSIPKFKNSPRNDGKDPIEQQETEVDDDFDDVDDSEMDPMDDEGLEDVSGDEEFGDLDDESDDPNRQGLIRVVPNAHLIYKRSNEEGTFDELWIYNLGDEIDKELDVRRGILSGTDIPQNKMSSPDGSQSYDMWSAGNAQLIHIVGLPS